MRIASLCLFAAMLTAAPAFAKDVAKLRPASEAEIRQTLAGTSKLEDGKNGYQYKAGSAVGYQIKDGQICVLRGQRPDCVTVYSDGKRLEMIDRRGNREFLN
jgi:hypothetical protein